MIHQVRTTGVRRQNAQVAWAEYVSVSGTRYAVNGASVHGVLWSLHPKHEAALDVYEGIRHGLYRKAFLPVRSAAGDAREALVYVAGDPTTGTAVSGYMEKVVAAAEHHGLPVSYIAELKGWLP